MTTIIALATTAIAGLFAYIFQLLSSKTKIETENRQLRSEKSEGIYEDESKESNKRAVDSVSNYRDLLERYNSTKDDR